MLLEDAGILKADFWDKASENHNNPRAMNYEKVGAARAAGVGSVLECGPFSCFPSNEMECEFNP